MLVLGLAQAIIEFFCLGPLILQVSPLGAQRLFGLSHLLADVSQEEPFLFAGLQRQLSATLLLVEPCRSLLHFAILLADVLAQASQIFFGASQSVL